MRLSLLRARRKGSLSLSTNAIVTIVLAFVMLGLGLSIIRTLGSNTSDAIPKALNLADLEQKPTADKPLTVDTIRLQGGATARTQIKLGFYNTAGIELTNVGFQIDKCLNPAGAVGSQEITSDLPVFTTLGSTVKASEIAALNVVVTKGTGLQTAGQYICNFQVTTDAQGGSVNNGVAYSQQIVVESAN